MNYFDQVPIEPLPMLAALREAVLSRSDKRMPKWKFRIAPDFVTQIQPKTMARVKGNREGRPWFDCLAIIHPNATGAMLQMKKPPRDAWIFEYKVSIQIDEGWNVARRLPDKWYFTPTRIGYDQTCLLSDRDRMVFSVRDRLVATLPVALAHLSPGKMLQPSCLMCGKAMTDPVSMARWIGPDCAHTTSATVPFMIQTYE